MPRGNQTPPTTISPLTRAELANLRLKAGVAQQTAEDAQAAVDSIYDDPHTWTATQDFSRITSGVGEQFSPSHGNPAVGGPHVEGSVLNIERGTTDAPDTTLQTPLKVSRVLQVTDADLAAIGPPAGTVGDQYLAAIAGFCKGTTLTTVQPIGVFGAGINYGQTDDPTLANTRPDGLGLAGYGYTAGPGGGIGGYFDGSRALATGYCAGIEVVVRNLAGTGNPVAYDPLNHKSCGIWVITSGDADIGAGVLIGQFSGQQFEVGFGILGTVVSGKTGGVRVASFRDDGNATTVFDVNGSHTNGLDTSGATFSSHAILLANGHTQSWGDVGLKRSGAGALSITDGGAGTGAIAAGAASFASLALAADLPISEGGTGAPTAAGARTNLGLGTAAVKNTGTSGDAVPLLNQANTWSVNQTIANTVPQLILKDTNNTGSSVGGTFLMHGSDDVEVLSFGNVAGVTQFFTVSPLIRIHANSFKYLELNQTANSVQLGFDASTAVNIPGTISAVGAASFASLSLAVALPITEGGTGSSTAAGARTSLGLVIGTDVQAFDTQLSAIAGLTPAAEQIIYWTSASAAAMTGLTAAGRALIDDADAAAQRATLAAAGTGDANAFTAQQTITAQAVASTRETVLKGTVSDAGNDAFFLSNFTSVDSRFQPALTGFTDTVDNVASLNFSGMIVSARDVTGDAGLGIVNVRAAITSSATDPNNGTLTAITNRTLFSVSNQATRVFGVTPAGANVGSGFAYYVNGTKVLGAQGAAVANATDAASVITQLNALLARCRAHGIIAT